MKASPSLSALLQGGGIRLPDVWLGEALEHQRDQWLLRRLLDQIAARPPGPAFRARLKIVTRLFQHHVQWTAMAPLDVRLHSACEHVFTLAEQIEHVADEDPILLSQAASLAFSMRLILDLENELRATGRWPAMPIEPAPILRLARQRLLRQAFRLLYRPTRRRARVNCSRSTPHTRSAVH